MQTTCLCRPLNLHPVTAWITAQISHLMSSVKYWLRRLAHEREGVGGLPGSYTGGLALIFLQRTQIKEKTELLDKGLTELISTDATPSGTSSRLEGRDESVVLYEQFESKVSELAKSKRQSDRKVKKLSSDVRKLRSENQKLKDQLRQVPQ